MSTSVDISAVYASLPSHLDVDHSDTGEYNMFRLFLFSLVPLSSILLIGFIEIYSALRSKSNL